MGYTLYIYSRISFRHLFDIINMRALVHCSGGSKGAYGAGVIKYLLGNLQIKYDIICGVSVGAINGSFLAQFPHGEEKIAALELSNMWSKLDASQVYQRWKPFGKWHAIWKKSFYDSSPLHNLIRNNIQLDKIRKSSKIVAVGTVSLSSGKYTIFDQNSDYFLEAVIASASFPAMLTPVEFMGQLWSDGGIKEISPLKKAIDLGATEIDVIVTSPQTRIKKFIPNPSTIDILKRSVDLSTDKILANDIEKIEMNNQLAKAGIADKQFIKLNIVRPDYNLIEDLLDFRPEKLHEMIEIGYADAKHKFIM